MTDELPVGIPEDAIDRNPEKEAWDKAKAENDAELHKSKITLVGGPADGTVFDIPDGVHNMKVEAQDTEYTYLRSERDPKTFVVYNPPKADATNGE